jgi:hypothetical protein
MLSLSGPSRRRRARYVPPVEPEERGQWRAGLFIPSEASPVWGGSIESGTSRGRVSEHLNHEAPERERHLRTLAAVIGPAGAETTEERD